MEFTLLTPAVADITTYLFNTRKTLITAPFVRKSTFDTFLLGKASDRLEFKIPFEVNIEPDEGCYLVSDTVFLVYGDGDSIKSAMDDYLSSLVEFYEIVKEKAERNPFEIKQLEILDSIITVK